MHTKHNTDKLVLKRRKKTKREKKLSSEQIEKDLLNARTFYVHGLHTAMCVTVNGLLPLASQTSSNCIVFLVYFVFVVIFCFR